MEEIFKNSKKIIIKIGSSTITGEDGKIDYEFLENLASEVKTLVGLEKQVVIVSSGDMLGQHQEGRRTADAVQDRKMQAGG